MPQQRKKIWFTIFGIFFLGILIFGLVNLFSKKTLMEDNIQKTQAEIEKHEKKNGELMEFIQYLKSDAFLESKARENFDLAKPEEKLIIIKNGEKKEESDTPAMETSRKNNFKVWFDYFF